MVKIKSQNMVFAFMKNCFGCGYHKVLKDDKGIPYHYCSDRDCRVDPHDPECNYD